MRDRWMSAWKQTLTLGVLAVAACGELSDGPTGVEMQAARGGGGQNPTVEASDPNWAPQDTTIDVRVIGSGFDEGSTVRFLVAGESTPKVVTNSSTFVDGNTLIANITVALDADVALYDIEVSTSRGKKGQGSELFSVVEKNTGPPPESPFEVTSTDLGSLDGGSVIAHDVSSLLGGQNTLTVGTENGDIGFYWTATGGIAALAAPPGATRTGAEGVSSAHHVVGTANLSDGTAPLLWPSPTRAPIVLPRGTASAGWALGVNAAGSVVGRTVSHSDDPPGDPSQHAALWDVDASGVATRRDLQVETFAGLGFLYSEAAAINDRGQVVGTAYDGTRERAFLWDDGAVIWLDGAVAPDHLSFPYAINDADPVQIVGGTHDQAGGARRVFIWTVHPDGSVTSEELPPLAGEDSAWPSDLDDAGRAVGGSGDRAVLWTFDPDHGGRVAVDLGLGDANAIDNRSEAGVDRVVGRTTIEVGKGKKRSRVDLAIMWEVRLRN